ncbi:MAG: hypothetical protein IPI49_20825 [Myxococcales bacterium]|nr:hypothetical protein [Myxococcales bacterium]
MHRPLDLSSRAPSPGARPSPSPVDRPRAGQVAQAMTAAPARVSPRALGELRPLEIP